VRRPLVTRARPLDSPPVNGDTEVLDRVRADADRVVLCCCGGVGRVVHAAVNRPGEPEAYVRATFTCTWDRPGPHEPLLPPRPA
jgi:hypothetical protein